MALTSTGSLKNSMDIAVKTISNANPIGKEVANAKRMKNQNFLNNLLTCK
jgi:hypothetical protein